MTNVTVEFNSIDFDIKSFIKCFDPIIQNFIIDLIGSGAYIAGGFVERCFFAYCHSFSEQKTADFLNHYIQRSVGDIDFWFEDDAKCQAVLDKVTVTYLSKCGMSNMIFSTYSSPWAENLCFQRKPPIFDELYTTDGTIKPIFERTALSFERNHKLPITEVRCQFIKKISGKAEEVVSNFDIQNAMCYIKDGKLFYEKGIIKLFQKKEINVLNYSGIFRVLSWYSKRPEYDGISQQTKRLLADSFQDICNLIINKQFKPHVTLPDFISLALGKIFDLPRGLCFLACQLSDAMSRTKYGQLAERFEKYVARPV